MEDIIELNKADHYAITVRCCNCGYDGGIEIPKGTVVKDADCLKCGCKTLQRSMEKLTNRL